MYKNIKKLNPQIPSHLVQCLKSKFNDRTWSSLSYWTLYQSSVPGTTSRIVPKYHCSSPSTIHLCLILRPISPSWSSLEGGKKSLCRLLQTSSTDNFFILRKVEYTFICRALLQNFVSEI